MRDFAGCRGQKTGNPKRPWQSNSFSIIAGMKREEETRQDGKIVPWNGSMRYQTVVRSMGKVTSNLFYPIFCF
jgi:hypothetical protein